MRILVELAASGDPVLTKVSLKGVHKSRVVGRNGRVREYHRLGRGKGAVTFWKSSDGIEVGSDAYFQEYIKALQLGNHAKGRFRSVIIGFLESAHFAQLAPRTRSDIRKTISHPSKGIDENFGALPPKVFEDPRIRQKALKWRNKHWGQSRQADISLAHLCSIVSWAYNEGHILKHHLRNVPKTYRSSRSHIVWLQHEIDLFCSDLAPEYVQRILKVTLETGLAPSDAVRLNLDHVQSGAANKRIQLRRSKTGVLTTLPVTSAMQDILDRMDDGQFYVLTNSKGKPWSHPNQMGKIVSKWRDELGIRKELHLYDARGTAATKFLMAGLSVAELAACMGWTVESAARMIGKYAEVAPSVTDDILAKLQRSKR